MTRKDSEKDAERPHYYSQFWLDIAAGRRVIGGPRPEEADTSEPEVPEPVLARKTMRSNASVADGYKETRSSAIVEPVEEEEEIDLEEPVEEIELPNIVVDDYVDETEGPVEEEEVEEASAEEVEEEPFGEEEVEDEEEDDEWNRRGRKKAKPVKPVKPVKKLKRDTRRSF